MKAVVTHIAGGRAVLLKRDGSFARVKNRGYRVGQQIGTGRTRKPVLRPLLVMASVVLVLFSATALAANALPFSYVSVDVNPSLKMTLNWFNRVLTVEAANEDAEEFVQRLLEEGIAGQPVGDAVQRVYAAPEMENYFAAGAENDVVVAVASYGIKDTAPVLNQLSEMQTVDSSGTALNVRTVETNRSMIAEADALGTTAGKLAMVKPIANGSAEETRAWLRRSVREIFEEEQGGAEPGEVTLTIETEPPVPSTEPPQEPTPGTTKPAGYHGGDPSPSPQPSPTAGNQGGEQNGPSQTPENTPKNTQKPTAAPTATPTPMLTPTLTPTPAPAPQNTAGGPDTTGDSGQTQSATPSPGGGHGKGN